VSRNHLDSGRDWLWCPADAGVAGIITAAAAAAVFNYNSAGQDQQGRPMQLRVLLVARGMHDYHKQQAGLLKHQLDSSHE